MRWTADMEGGCHGGRGQVQQPLTMARCSSMENPVCFLAPHPPLHSNCSLMEQFQAHRGVAGRSKVAGWLHWGHSNIALPQARREPITALVDCTGCFEWDTVNSKGCPTSCAWLLLSPACHPLCHINVNSSFLHTHCEQMRGGLRRQQPTTSSRATAASNCRGNAGKRRGRRPWQSCCDHGNPLGQCELPAHMPNQSRGKSIMAQIGLKFVEML